MVRILGVIVQVIYVVQLQMHINMNVNMLS